MSDTIRRAVRKLWGTDEQFYSELKRFMEQHRDAQAIRYDNESKLPIEAVYVFMPLQVYREDIQLRAKLAEVCSEKDESK